jgi:protein tyrosine/serine phosphatase
LRPGLLRHDDPERPAFLVLNAKLGLEFHRNHGIDRAGKRRAGTL